MSSRTYPFDIHLIYIDKALLCLTLRGSDGSEVLTHLFCVCWQSKLLCQPAK